MDRRSGRGRAREPAHRGCDADLNEARRRHRYATLRAFAPAAAFAAGALAARVLAARLPAALHADLRAPLPVVTAWGPSGALAVGILLATIVTVAVTGRPGRAAAPARRQATPVPESAATLPLPVVLAASLVAVAAAGSWPFVFSSDVYAYAAYGEAVLGGQNPYRALPVAPLAALAVWQWGGPVPHCTYGPVFVALAAAITAAGRGLGPAATLAGFRMLAATAFAGCVWLIARGPGHPVARARRAAAFGLHPLVIWTVAEGHNDVVALFVVLFGLFGLRAVVLPETRPRSRLLAGTVAGLGAALKATAALEAIVLAGLLGVRARAWAGLALGIAVAAGTTAFAIAADASARLGGEHRTVPSGSLQALATGIAGAVRPDDAAARMVALVVAAAIPVALIVAGVRVWRHGNRDGFGLAVVGIWLAIPNPYPWYALWLVPVAQALPRGRVRTALGIATITAGARYLSDAAPGTIFEPFSALLLAGPVLAALALPLPQKAGSVP